MILFQRGSDECVLDGIALIRREDVVAATWVPVRPRVVELVVALSQRVGPVVDGVNRLFLSSARPLYFGFYSLRRVIEGNELAIRRSESVRVVDDGLGTTVEFAAGLRVAPRRSRRFDRDSPEQSPG